MKNKKKKFAPFLLAMLFFAAIMGGVGVFLSKKNVAAEDDPKAVYLFKKSSYERGGVIEIAATDAPVIKIGSVNTSGLAKVTTYEANYDALLQYLIHNDDYDQKNKNVDLGQFQQISQTQMQVNADDDSTLPLSIGENGIWLVRAELNGVVGNAFVIRSEVGSIASEGDNEIIIWNQNFKTRKLIPDAKVTVYDLNGKVSAIETVTADAQGVAKVQSKDKADVAIIESNGNKALLPLNYKYLNSGNYVSFGEKELDDKYFIFTDRPLYRPGDTVKFKSIIRQDDDAVYKITEGKVIAKVIKGWDEEDVVAQQTLSISREGTVNGEFILPANLEAQTYTLVIQSKEDESIWGNSIGFEVQEFVKPEYGIETTSNNEILIAGDEISVDVHGAYFSGQPLAKENVKYTIYASNYEDYGYRDEFDLNDKWNWWWGGGSVFEGNVSLDENGEGTIKYRTPYTNEDESSKVYTIEAEYLNESGRPSVSISNVMVKSGEFDIYKKDYTWSTKVNEKISIPFVVQDKNGSAVKNSIPLEVKSQWSIWRRVEKDGDVDYERDSEDLPVEKITSENGEFSYAFTPKKAGSYEITFLGKDARGNMVHKTYSFWAYSDKEYSYYTDYGTGSLGISVKSDKEKYNPGDQAKITILSKEADRDAFISWERGRSRRYKVVRLSSTETTLTEKIQNDDIPNIFITASSFGASDIDKDSLNVAVSTASKKINIKITPDKKTYAPGDMAVVDIKATDLNGNPISTDAAVWAIDKAIYELADSNRSDIMDTFWYKRGNGTSNSHSLQGISSFGAEAGGCFAGGTEILMSDNSQKKIEDISVGDKIMTYESENGKMIEATVSHTHKTTEHGYLIINNRLRVTPNHVLWVNGDWRQAGMIQIGDTLRMVAGDEKVDSIQWQREDVVVYNFTVDDYHTYIADGIWVHNNKDGGVRSDLKDTAYWNPSVMTDANGNARVTFKLPDNLTTWIVASIAASSDTKVGENVAEIVVSKNIIVRPIVPNVLQEGDEIILGAMVQNFSEEKREFFVELESNVGKIESATQKITIDKNASEKVYWKVVPEKENEKAFVQFKATATDRRELADGVYQEIPVKKYGFMENFGSAIVNGGEFSFAFPEDAINEKSKATVTVSASLVSSLSSAMKYLLQYPYGCVEQTTSRFVPAIILKQNASLFGEVNKDVNVDDAIKKGLDRLKSLQIVDGGWGWWAKNNSNPLITAYVAEYLVKAKNAGYSVDADMYGLMSVYVKEKPVENLSVEDRRMDQIGKAYALSQLEKGRFPQRQITDFSNLTPDVLALAVMANINNGNSDRSTNGLAALMAMAHDNNGVIFWDAGKTDFFGSSEASTALALRALIMGKADGEFMNKVVQYLAAERKAANWENTFATAQVLQALVDYAKLTRATATNASYAVMLNGEEIAKGSFNDFKQSQVIAIPVDKMKRGNATIKIAKQGAGEIFSTVAVEAFRTKKDVAAENKGFAITRMYKPVEIDAKTLAVGDLVDVTLTVENKFDDKYIVIDDHLPSGLIPVNENLKNEKAAESKEPLQRNDAYYYGLNKEFTKDGVIFSLEDLPKGSHTFNYRARVVNQGTFNVIPTVISKMYAPNVYGRSASEKIVIEREHKNSPAQLIAKNKKIVWYVIGVIVIILLSAAGYYIWQRKYLARQ